uniref:Uncharacterized protein n=1 Tax=Physcomitrium patens TaxID=3218 RepID=A0A2K1IYA8_PHYPA|nr:hypothetical protein PHYPA_024079 [Physcomitrium patens]
MHCAIKTNFIKYSVTNRQITRASTVQRPLHAQAPSSLGPVPGQDKNQENQTGRNLTRAPSSKRDGKREIEEDKARMAVVMRVKDKQ